MELTFYAMNEVIGGRINYFVKALDDYPNLKDVPTKIIANYQDWYGLWLDSSLTEAEVEAEKINQTGKMTAWLITKAIYWNDYIERQSKFSGKQESTSKFLDTPETETDYSGDTHVTNITKSTTEQDNALGLETLRPVIEMLVQEFRKTWLLPKEAI